MSWRLPLNIKRLFTRLVIATSLVLWGSSVFAATSNEAKLLLERMSAALQELSYEGVFVYRSGESLSAMRVTHTAYQEGEREVLVTLTGQEKEISRNSRRFGALASTSPMGQLASGRLVGVENYYKITLLGRDRVAGLYANVVLVAPRDEYRYGYRLWIDEETGLLLKSDLLNVDKQVLEQVMFTSISLLDAPINDAEDKPSLPPQGEGIDIATAKERTNWEVGELPSGFQLSNMLPVDARGVEHMVFTDGLASVSVFIESIKSEENTFKGASQMGAVNAFGHVVSGYQVTVVGEVPPNAVKRIALSLRLKDK